MDQMANCILAVSDSTEEVIMIKEFQDIHEEDIQLISENLANDDDNLSHKVTNSIRNENLKWDSQIKSEVIRNETVEGFRDQQIRSTDPNISADDLSANTIDGFQDDIIMISDEIVLEDDTVVSGSKNVDMYFELLNMFPHIEASYIKNICSDKEITKNAKTKEELMTILVNNLLNKDEIENNELEAILISEKELDTFDFCEEIVESPEEKIFNDKYQMLIGMFPNADPTYLRKCLSENEHNENFLEDFVNRLTSKPTYPTRAEYNERVKKNFEIKQYMKKFNIQKFLETFPEPFEYFEDPHRVCTQKPDALKFLHSFFNDKAENISFLYNGYKYNVSLTAKWLEKNCGKRQTPLYVHDWPTDISLLEEIVFIKNKDAIQRALQKIKEKEKAEFLLLKEDNNLFKCNVCFDDEIMPKNIFMCENSDAMHTFCRSCIAKGTDVAIGAGLTQVKCFITCDSQFSLDTLQKCMLPTIFSKFLKRKEEAEVVAAGIDGLSVCPFCSFAMIVPKQLKIFKCLYPECLKESCLKCKKLNHAPLKCGEDLELELSAKGREFIQVKMSEAMIIHCYKCKKPFVKDGGCNAIQCTCGAFTCYVCRQPMQHHDSHKNTCYLHKNDKEINSAILRESAHRAYRVVHEENPNIKIDLERLLS